jgi:hypothetical protein
MVGLLRRAAAVVGVLAGKGLKSFGCVGDDSTDAAGSTGRREAMPHAASKRMGGAVGSQ